MNTFTSSSKEIQPRQATGLPGKYLPLVVVFIMMVFLLVFTVITFSGASEVVIQPVLQAISPAPTGSLSPVFTSSVQHWAPQILAWSAEYDVDPNLIATVMQIESCGNPNAYSSAGASGLFQVMPFHFADGEDPFDPETNAYRGIAYLSSSLRSSGGDAGFALAGYNGGIGIISTGQENWADETIDYMYWGSGIYSDAQSGAQQSARLQEWIQAGGSSLCNSAQMALGVP